MKRKLVTPGLPSILPFVVFLCVACAPAPAAFDLRATLDQYLHNLPDGYGMLTPAALNDYIQTAKPFIVDVREPKEVADGGYIAGSINIPVRAFVKNLDKLPAKDQAIVVTCGSGHRSALGMQALQLLGYTHVKSLAGGVAAWKAANLPVVRDTPPEAKAGQAPDVDKDLLAALDKYFTSLPDGWGTMTAGALNDLVKTSHPFQLEVREAKELAESGYIAGATHIPLRALVKNLDKLPPDKGAPIIAECANGHRSAMAMMTLSLLGYSNVKSLAGGFAAWAKLGLPISKQ